MAFRTHPHKHKANKGKVEKVKDLRKPYRQFASDVAKVQWNNFFLTGSFNKNLAPLSAIESDLSERQRQVCQYQVVGILESFTSNLVNYVREIIKGSKLDQETKTVLFYINKYKLWYKQDVTMPLFVDGKRVKGEKVIVEHKVLKFSTRLFKQALSKHKRPTYDHINMALDAKVVDVSPKVPDKATEFPYWLKVSTLEKGKPVLIPLEENPYFESVEGEIKNFVFVNEKGNGIEFCLVKDKNRIPYEPLTEQMSLDYGLAVMFATPYGDLYGRKFFDRLKEKDEILTDLAKNRQRQNLNVSSKRYKRIRNKFKEEIHNEICRVLNCIVKQYRPAKIVVEKLDFRRPELSRKMNRLLTQCGRKAIEIKLQCLAEDYGIEIEYVNPAYTSQECSNCGWTQKENRKSRDKFVCKRCGLTIHADVNGSRVIGSRSSTSLANPYVSRDAIFNALRDRFFANVERYPHYPYLGGGRRNSPANGSLPDVIPVGTAERVPAVSVCYS
jgi:putative transposase